MAVVQPPYPLINVDGSFGAYTKEVWQRHLKFGGYYTRAIDAVFGAQSWMAVQRWLVKLGYYNRAIDGDPGYITMGALHSALRKYGFGVPAGTSTYWPNSVTCQSIQRYLNKYGRYPAGLYPKV